MSIKQIAIACDQLLHTLIGGMADETLSAAAWRWHSTGVRSWPNALINRLFMDESHCYLAYLAEVKRKQLPISYQELMQ